MSPELEADHAETLIAHLPLGFPVSLAQNLNNFRLQKLADKLKRSILPSQQKQHFFSRLTASEVPLEVVQAKLAMGEQLSSAEAAVYYREIDKLDDGKIRALTSSLLVTPIIQRVSSMAMHNDQPPTIYDQLEGDVLVLGGYRGSILRDSITKRRAWIPVLKAGLNIKKINLMIGPKVEDELHVTDTVYPDGMLTHIGPVDVSKKLIKRLSTNPKVKVHDWGYDWRISLDITSEQLYQHIKHIYASNGNKPIILIGHSMGGLVAHGAMVKDPKLVRGIIYAGTPFPCGNVLGPMRFNDQILFAKDILTCEVNFLMRSSFIFVPRKELGMFRDINTGEFIKDDDGTPLDYWKPQTWVRFNGNPLVSGVRWRLDHKYQLDTIVKLLSNDKTANQHHHYGEPHPSHNRLYSNISNYTGSHEHIQHLITTLKSGLPKGVKFEDVVPPNGVDKETESIVLQQISSQAKLVISFNDAYDYLERTLSKTNSFIDSLKRKPDVIYPPMVVLYSNSTPSVKFCLLEGQEAARRGEYYNFFYADGDGVGYKEWLFPRDSRTTKPKSEDGTYKTLVKGLASEELEGFGYDSQWAYDIKSRVKCENSHIGLLSDLDKVGEALEAIVS